MKLSNNFPLNEFTKSMTAIRRGIENEPNEEQIEALRELAQNVLQKVRDHFGITIITSGFRSYELNKAIGGSQNSQHSKGEAADIEVVNTSNYVVAKWIMDNLDFDQLILEYYTPGIPNSGWVHVSYKNISDNRNQVLTAIKQNGETVYLNGLIE
jgi:zinc D-Ala-D-Ala carboxypeptidase